MQSSKISSTQILELRAQLEQTRVLLKNAKKAQKQQIALAKREAQRAQRTAFTAFRCLIKNSKKIESKTYKTNKTSTK